MRTKAKRDIRSLEQDVMLIVVSELIIIKKSTKITGLVIWVSPSKYTTVGRGGALVESIDFNRRVVGSTPSLAAT